MIYTANYPGSASSLAIATGGLSIPKFGAMVFGYDIVAQFGLALITQRAGRMHLTFADEMKKCCAALSGLLVESSVYDCKTLFD